MLKEQGNGSYKNSNYVEAKRIYSEAIVACPLEEQKTLAILYQNRAAASDAMV